MAEVVGLVASILTLAETGFKVARAISEIAAEFGTAGRQIQAIGTDTRAVSLILREIQKRLKRVRNVAGEAHNVAVDVVALCKSDIDNIDEFLKSLQPIRGSEVSIKQKTKFLFSKSRMSLRRASLDSLKLTLSLFMHTLEFIESGEVDEHIKEEVDRLIMNSKDTKKDLLNAEHADQKMVVPYQKDGETEISDSLRIENSEDLNGEITVVTSRFIQSLEFEDSNSEKQDPGADKPLQLYDPQANIFLMQSISDDIFILIAEHVRVQKRTASFALVVMDPRRRFLDSKESTNSVSKSPKPTTRNRDSYPRDLIRFKFDIPAEDVWYPMALCRDMKEMHANIMDIVSSSGLNSEDVQLLRMGEYTLLDSKRQVILARFWKDAVKAGTEIVLRTNPKSHTQRRELWIPTDSRIRQMGAELLSSAPNGGSYTSQYLGDGMDRM